MQVVSESQIIEGSQGPIEAVLDMPKNTNTPFISVNCHPHSLHGGSLSNKVVYTMSRAMAALGIAGLRFNFRGVGQSAGNYDEGRGEQEDLELVVNWMRQRFPAKQLLLSGFSFGSYVSAMAAQKLEPALLLSVAPPVDRFDFAQFIPPACRWHVIMGDADELVSYPGVCSWLGQFDPIPPLHTLENAGHFFHGRLVELRETVTQIIQQELLPHADS